MTQYEISEPYEQAINDMAAVIHQCNVDRGWWNDLYEVLDLIEGDPTLSINRCIQLKEKVRLWFEMSKAALIHSEVSEMVEGMRKRSMDSHLPERMADEVEGADVFIRLLDLMAARDCDIGGAVGEKFEYNQERADHLPENRQGLGGKLV